VDTKQVPVQPPAAVITKHTEICETPWILHRQGIYCGEVVELFRFRFFEWLEMDQTIAWATNLVQNLVLHLKAEY
jgi:hypothetical protein